MTGDQHQDPHMLAGVCVCICSVCWANRNEMCSCPDCICRPKKRIAVVETTLLILAAALPVLSFILVVVGAHAQG